MAIEAGAKNGIFPVDEQTLAYVKGRTEREPVRFMRLIRMLNMSASWTLTSARWIPLLPCPYLPGNDRNWSSDVKGIVIDQVVIGSCTNGRIR